MSRTNIASLWNPPVWINGIAERVTTRPGLINSGILISDPEITLAASGPGTKIEIPFVKEVHIDDAPQVEDNDAVFGSVSSGQQTAAILNREVGIGRTALSKAVSGVDGLRLGFDFIGDNRLRNRQKTLLSMLRGIFGIAAAPNAGTAAFKALRKDIFIEAGGSAAAGNLFSGDAFLDTLQLLGELKEVMQGAVIVTHSVIETAMTKQDDIATIRDSAGEIVTRTYKGQMPVFLSDALVRAGATSGFVYETYILLPGSVAYGEKPQVPDVGEAASLQYLEDASKNNVGVIDRTRFIMHPQGAKWGGTPAGQSATNAELATEANWTSPLADIKNARILCLRTNG